MSPRRAEAHAKALRRRCGPPARALEKRATAPRGCSKQVPPAPTKSEISPKTQGARYSFSACTGRRFLYFRSQDATCGCKDDPGRSSKIVQDENRIHQKQQHRTGTHPNGSTLHRVPSSQTATRYSHSAAALKTNSFTTQRRTRPRERGRAARKAPDSSRRTRCRNSAARGPAR